MSAAHCGLGGEASVDKSKHLVHRVAQVAHGLAQGKVPCTVHAIPVLLVFVHILGLMFVFVLVLVLGTAPCVSNVHRRVPPPPPCGSFEWALPCAPDQSLW